MSGVAWRWCMGAGGVQVPQAGRQGLRARGRGQAAEGILFVHK
jgi:hypothetical protein